MHRLRLVFAFLIVLVPDSRYAIAASPLDFAYGLSVSVPAGATLAEISLPAQVYRDAVFADLRDLRVFDATGAMAMHAITFPRADAKRRQLIAPFYPVRGRQRAAGVAVMVNAKLGAGDVRIQMDNASSAGERTVAYLVDVRALGKLDARQAVTSVEVGWRGLPDGVPLRIGVEASDDLQVWRVIREGATVARFTDGAGQLTVNQIDVPRTETAYLKLWWEPGMPFEVTAVTVHLADAAGPDLVREWEQVEAMAGTEPGPFFVTLAGAFPIDQFKVVLPGNGVVPVAVYSRTEPEAAWTRRGGGKAFRLFHAGGSVESGALQLERTTDRHWKIVVEGKDAVAGRASLSTSFGWLPHRLQFLPQGTGPYTVAYGNGRAERADFGVASLEKAVTRALGDEAPKITQAKILSTHELGGPKRLAGPGTNRRVIVLWGVLLAGVILFGSMALKLFRETKATLR